MKNTLLYSSHTNNKTAMRWEARAGVAGVQPDSDVAYKTNHQRPWKSISTVRESRQKSCVPV